MRQSLARLPLVLEVFTLWFSHQWIGHWQKKWRAQKQLTGSQRGRQGRPAQGPDSQQKKNQKKPAQGRFYERIFSLRVTLWYLIFQRLNFDQTLAGGWPTCGREERIV